jgi:hypothetical protein
MPLKVQTTLHFSAAHTITQARFYRTAANADISASTSSNVASTVPPSPAATSAEASPQTYFDFLDRAWNAKWFGTVDEHAMAAATTHAAVGDPSWFAQAFTACQHALGVDAGTLIVLVGAATRFCTLFFSLYGERAGERMRLALPELKKPQDDFNRVYYNDLASAMEVQVAASVLKSHRRVVFCKYQTSNWKCMSSLAMAPVIMIGLYQVSAMCENAALDVGSSSFLWCSALALPDPFMVLPMVTCVITLLNFELSISKEIKTGWMKNVIWGARLGCLCIIPVFSTFRSGVCLYLVGMNVVGLLQPLLLRSVAFRRWLGFPSAKELSAVAPAHATHPTRSASENRGRAKELNKLGVRDRATSLRERIAAAVNPTATPRNRTSSSSEGAPQDVLQASMTVQFPYFSHLLNPQVDENEELFAKARSKQSKPDFGRRGPITASSPAPPSAGSRYARGANPLMCETPLHHHGGAGTATGNTDSGVTTAPITGHAAAPSATAPAPVRRTPRNKGLSFASSGWKTAQLTFDENDFTPYGDEGSAASPSTKRK